jgi:hypothetical protein
MAVTRTQTATKTFTRVSLIKMQVDRVMTRAGLSAGSAEKILHGIEKRWIAHVFLYGLDGAGLCHCELFMRIDWQRNQIHIAAGRDQVTIDSRWRDDVAVEVEKAMMLFEEYVAEKQLKVVVHTRYGVGVDRQLANRELGFVNATDVKWAGGTVGSSMTVPEVDEFTVGINLLDE